MGPWSRDRALVTQVEPEVKSLSLGCSPSHLFNELSDLSSNCRLPGHYLACLALWLLGGCLARSIQSPHTGQPGLKASSLICPRGGDNASQHLFSMGAGKSPPLMCLGLTVEHDGEGTSRQVRSLRASLHPTPTSLHLKVATSQMSRVRLGAV